MAAAASCQGWPTENGNLPLPDLIEIAEGDKVRLEEEAAL